MMCSVKLARELIMSTNKRDISFIQNKSIKKPKRFLLHNFHLSNYAQDIYALMLLQLKSEFDGKFFEQEPSEIRENVLLTLQHEFHFTLDELSELFELTPKVINKKNTDGVYFLKTAIQELRRAEITIHGLYDEDNNPIVDNEMNSWRVTGLINWGEWDGSILTLNLDPYISYELIEYAHNGGFSFIDKSVFFKIRDATAKKIFELVSSDKRKQFRCNLFDYLHSVCDFNEDKFNQSHLLQKHLTRPIGVLLRDSDGLLFKNSDRGYRLIGLGGSRGTSVTSKTIVEFEISHKEKIIEDSINESTLQKSIKLFDLIKDAKIIDDSIIINNSDFNLDEISTLEWRELYRNICDIDLMLATDCKRLISSDVKEIISVMSIGNALNYKINS